MGGGAWAAVTRLPVCGCLAQAQAYLAFSSPFLFSLFRTALAVPIRSCHAAGVLESRLRFRNSRVPGFVGVWPRHSRQYNAGHVGPDVVAFVWYRLHGTHKDPHTHTHTCAHCNMNSKTGEKAHYTPCSYQQPSPGTRGPTHPKRFPSVERSEHLTPAPMAPGSNPRIQRVHSASAGGNAAASEHSNRPQGRAFGPGIWHRWSDTRLIVCRRVGEWSSAMGLYDSGTPSALYWQHSSWALSCGFSSRFGSVVAPQGPMGEGGGGGSTGPRPQCPFASNSLTPPPNPTLPPHPFGWPTPGSLQPAAPPPPPGPPLAPPPPHFSHTNSHHPSSPVIFSSNVPPEWLQSSSSWYRWLCDTG